MVRGFDGRSLASILLNCDEGEAGHKPTPSIPPINLPNPLPRQRPQKLGITGVNAASSSNQCQGKKCLDVFKLNRDTSPVEFERQAELSGL